MRRFLLLTTLAVICASCGADTGTSPTTDAADTRTTLTFAGTIGPGGTKFYSFTVATAGQTDITLVSLRPAAAAVPALATPMALSLGTPAGTGCRVSTTVTAQPAFLPQLTTQTTPTVYCANLTDVGQLVAATAFTIRITHP